MKLLGCIVFHLWMPYMFHNRFIINFFLHSLVVIAICAFNHGTWEESARVVEKEVEVFTPLRVSGCKLYVKLQQIKSGQVARELTEWQQWIWDQFHFLLFHINQVTKGPFRPSTPLPPLSEEEEVDLQLPPPCLQLSSTRPTPVKWPSSKTRRAGCLHQRRGRRNCSKSSQPLLFGRQVPGAMHIPEPACQCPSAVT